MAKEKSINGGGGGASTQSNSIDSKASVLSGYSLSTSVQTVVGAINEIQGKLGIVSYPENTTDDSSNVIRLGKDSPEVIKKKVFGGVPYVIIEPSETWNSEYYSNLLDEDGFHSWYENTIADNTCIYEIYNVLTIQTDEENGFGIAIRVLKPQPAPGPLAVVVNGPEVSTNPLDFIDMTCVFANNEESILSYELNAWRTTTSVIYTEPPVSSPIAAGRGLSSAIIGNLYTNNADGDYSVAEGYSTTASGKYSHAEGHKTTAIGNYSHAEGYSTIAAGDYSHAEGGTTTASTSWSHAEGWRTEASGDCSHAEGDQTTASGMYSHAEGKVTQATGQGAHAEGYFTTASGDYSHAEGTKTTALNPDEHAEGYNNVSNSGKTDDLRTRHSVGIGSHLPDIRMNAHEIMANGDHYIYGLGGYDGTNATADTTQTLQEVINSKQETITAGTGLEFEGNTLNVTLDTTVFKVVSVLPDSPAQGDENKIHLVPAESTGTNNIYTEYAWVNSAWEILGEYTSEVDLTPYLKSSDAQATYATKTELTAHTGNTSNPHNVTAAQVGLGNVDNTSDADKPISTATQAALDLKQDITDNTLETTSKTVVGAINEILPKATGVGKVDPNSDGTDEIFNSYEGDYANVASGGYSHAEGSRTTASGQYAHAEGYNCTASGLGAHAEGQETAALESRSHAEGVETTASGEASHAEGGWTEASNFAAHAEGSHTIASGRYSHAEGYYTEASGIAAHAEGEYNFDDSFAIHMVGIGTSKYNRKNAHVIESGTGDHFIIGIGGYEGQATNTAQSLQTVITGLQSSIRTRQSEQTVYTEVPELTADYQIPANDTFVERVYIIPVGDTLYSVTGDSSILWAGGIAPNPSANSVLVVSIVKNLAIWNVFLPI